MLITLIRDTFTPAETLGKLYIDRKLFCDTLEPPTVPNAQHPKGGIPEGWYKIQVTRSPKFGRLLPLLYYVPGFEGIRIHAGNNRDHTSGCILVGERSERQGTPTLYSSKATEEALTKELIKAQNNHEEIYIEVTDTERYAVERMSEPASYEYLHG